MITVFSTSTTHCTYQFFLHVQWLPVAPHRITYLLILLPVHIQAISVCLNTHWFIIQWQIMPWHKTTMFGVYFLYLAAVLEMWLSMFMFLIFFNVHWNPSSQSRNCQSMTPSSNVDQSQLLPYTFINSLFRPSVSIHTASCRFSLHTFPPTESIFLCEKIQTSFWKEFSNRM